MKKLACYGSHVLIKPLGKDQDTYRGQIIAKGTTGAIQLVIGDIVHYHETDVKSEVTVNSEVIHCADHYKICFIEIGENDEIVTPPKLFDPVTWGLGEVF